MARAAIRDRAAALDSNDPMETPPGPCAGAVVVKNGSSAFVSAVGLSSAAHHEKGWGMTLSPPRLGPSTENRLGIASFGLCALALALETYRQAAAQSCRWTPVALWKGI
jgi:hypothetical protein